MRMLLIIMALSLLQINSLDAAAKRGKQKGKKSAAVQVIAKDSVEDSANFNDFLSEFTSVIADRVGTHTLPSGVGQAPCSVQYQFVSDDTTSSNQSSRAIEQNPAALANVNTALFAASHGDLMTIKKLAEEGVCFNTPDPNDAKFGWTCAMYAADNNRVHVLDFLLRDNPWGRSYASPESVDNLKQNILMIAAARPACSAAVAKIVALCPELIETNKANCCEDFASCEEGVLCETCREQVDMFSPLSCAAKYGCYDAIHIMLECNSSLDVINAKNKNGTTALMIAAQYGHNEIVMRLSLAESNPFLSDTSGQTAYDYAQNAGYVRIAASIKKYEELYNAPHRVEAVILPSQKEECDASAFSDDELPDLASLTDSSED